MNLAFTNPIKLSYLVLLKERLKDLLGVTLLRLAIWNSGSRINDIGVSINLVLPSQSKKKIGQASVRGRGTTLTKSPVFPIFPMTEERIAKRRTKSAAKKTTKSLKPAFHTSTGKTSKKTPTTSKARSN